MPELAEVNAEFEQAVFMEWCLSSRVGLNARWQLFHREIICNEHGQAGLLDPVQQLRVAAIECCTSCVNDRRVWLAAHFHDDLRKACVQANHIAGFDDNAVSPHHL